MQFLQIKIFEILAIQVTVSVLFIDTKMNLHSRTKEDRVLWSNPKADLYCQVPIS